jgi:hypothetical protein
MRNIVKLLTAVLVFGFLVGCGGGGGGSSSSDNTSKGDDPTTPSGGDTSISLALIGSYFPAFPDSAYTLDYVETNKEYAVSAAQVASFKASVIQAQSYTDLSGDEYTKAGVLPNIDAFVALDSKGIDLYLYTSLEFDKVAQDDTYKSVFGDISGDVVYAYIYKYYNEDISSKFDAYALTLGNTANKFNCSKPSGGDWECQKTVDGITYVWSVDDNYSYAYDVFY